jgi:hypothetical protein
MRIPFLIFIAATSAFAFSSPWGLPTTTLTGKVLSVEKVGDYGKDKVIHWELWKADVQVQQVEGSDTNIASRVFVYYSQDWSTNAVDIAGMHVGQPPLLRPGTNQIYEFICRNHTDIKQEMGISDETNGLSVLVGQIREKTVEKATPSSP